MAGPSPRTEGKLRAFCRAVGTADLESWLGIPPGTRGPGALHALERKRLTLEAGMSNPMLARQAELLTDSYDLLHRALARQVTQPGAADTVLPDYYAALGLHEGATFNEIESAFRERRAAGAPPDDATEQAWRVLGDPVNRASYDRSRRESLAEPEGTWTPDPPTPVSEPSAPARATLRVDGALSQDLEVSGSRPVETRIRCSVTGPGLVDVAITTSHPAVTVRGAPRRDLAAGAHTIQLDIDPFQLDNPVERVSVTVRSRGEEAVVQLVLRKRPTTSWTRWERGDVWTALAAAALLVGFGWWLGTRTTVASTQRQPSRVGLLAEIPAAMACVGPSPAPRPGYVDIHTDGLGRATGFQFGGPASPAVESCMKEALLSLELPRTPDGLPTFHRYHLSEVPP